MLQGDWKVYQKIDVRFYPMTCTVTESIPEVRLNNFCMTHVMCRGFIMTSEGKSIVLKKKTDI